MRTTKSLADAFAAVLGPVAECYAAETGHRMDVAGLVRAAGRVAARWLRIAADKLDTQVKAERAAEVVPVAEPQQEQTVPAGWQFVETSVPVEEQPAAVPVEVVKVERAKPSRKAKAATELKAKKSAPRKPAAKQLSKSTTGTKAKKVKPAAKSHAARVRAERQPKSQSSAK
jgi:hypothetical protein